MNDATRLAAPDGAPCPDDLAEESLRLRDVVARHDAAIDALVQRRSNVTSRLAAIELELEAAGR